jgi:hypothetical protein
MKIEVATNVEQHVAVMVPNAAGELGVTVIAKGTSVGSWGYEPIITVQDALSGDYGRPDPMLEQLFGSLLTLAAEYQPIYGSWLRAPRELAVYSVKLAIDRGWYQQFEGVPVFLSPRMRELPRPNHFDAIALDDLDLIPDPDRWSAETALAISRGRLRLSPALAKKALRHPYDALLERKFEVAEERALQAALCWAWVISGINADDLRGRGMRRAARG